jgi:hypothetical protein
MQAGPTLNWDRIREGARELGVSLPAVSMWKHRGRVPHEYHLQLVERGYASWDALRHASRRKRARPKSL